MASEIVESKKKKHKHLRKKQCSFCLGIFKVIEKKQSCYLSIYDKRDAVVELTIGRWYCDFSCLKL